jgi:RimJ/RimL family protein N-acetyltransferase
MESTKSIYEGRLVCLGPIDYEKDPEVVSRWTRDPLLRTMIGGVAHPLSPEAVRKMLEKIEKSMDERKNLFNFMLRDRGDDRLVGMANISLCDLNNGSGRLALAIGEPGDWRHGYGTDALTLLLRFSFGELNLHRVSIWPTEDNAPMILMVEKAGFEREICRRQAAFHNGEYWNEIGMGMLASKWEGIQ